MYSQKSWDAAELLLQLNAESITALTNWLRRYQTESIKYANEDFDRKQHLASLIYFNTSERKMP